jgi:hypothetical protein
VCGSPQAGRSIEGTKYFFQTKLFHYSIRQNNVMLYRIISARSEEAIRTGCIVYNGGQVSEANISDWRIADVKISGAE